MLVRPEDLARSVIFLHQNVTCLSCGETFDVTTSENEGAECLSCGRWWMILWDTETNLPVAVEYHGMRHKEAMERGAIMDVLYQLEDKIAKFDNLAFDDGEALQEAISESLSMVLEGFKATITALDALVERTPRR